MLASRGPSSLYASRDGELSSSQGCLLHPCVFGSVRKFFLKVILALSPAPLQALRSSPGGGQGKLPASSLSPPGGGEEAARVRWLGSQKCVQRSATLELQCRGLPGLSSFLSTETWGFSLLGAAFQALRAPLLPPVSRGNQGFVLLAPPTRPFGPARRELSIRNKYVSTLSLKCQNL